MNYYTTKIFTRTNLYFLPAFLLCNLLISAAVKAEVTVTYFHTDALGSVVAASDESGSLLWRKSYSPYGEKVADGEGDTNAVSFTGKKHDDVTGLTYFGARYYDPEVGRFMGMDPANFVEINPISFNRYAYASDNPYKYVDPDGRVAIKAYYVPTGKRGEQKMAWRLNVKLTTSKFDYYAEKYGARNLKGLVRKIILDKTMNPAVGPSDDGDNATDVVAIDKSLEKAGIKNSSCSNCRQVDPKDFIDKVNNLSKKDRKLFKSVHGMSASGMVKKAKENYNKSLQKKVIDGMSKNVE